MTSRVADARVGVPWLASEYIPGPTLADYAARSAPLTGQRLMVFAAGVAGALAAIHDAGVVHRDLKPSNVILSPEGPKVLDFGIARAAEETAITQTGGLFGSPGWLAPEQYSGAEPAPAADMFAMGGLIAFTATGRNPFGRGSLDVLAHRTRNEEPDTAGVPDHLLPVLTRALSKDPQLRPSAAEALDTFTGHWTATRPLPPGEQDATELVPVLLRTEWRGITAPPARRTTRTRHRLLLAVAAAVAVLVLGGWGLGQPGEGIVPGLGAPEAGDETTEAGTDRDGDEDDGGDQEPAVIADPGESGAVLAQAAELFSGAESFEVVLRETSLTEEEFRPGRFYTMRYTEDPEPAFHFWRTAELGVANFHTYRTGDDFDDVLFGEDFGEGEPTFRRDPDAAEEQLAQSRPEDAIEDLTQVIETSEDITHQGREELEASFEVWDEQVGTSAERYSGTFSRSEWQFNENLGAMEEVLHEGTPFDIWIDDEGYPVRINYTYDFEEEIPGQTAVNHEVLAEVAYITINEDVAISIPDEQEIE